MVRVCVIGCGRWGPNYVRNFMELRDSEVVACCDADAQARQRMQRMWPEVPMLPDLASVLDTVDFDAGVVSTPAVTHRALVEQLLSAGKHVLVEKPLAGNLEDAEAVAQQAEASHGVVMVGHVFRYNSGVNKLRDLIYDGTVDEMRYIECVRTNLGPVRDDVSVIWDLAAHDVSIVLHLLNDMPARVSATGAAFLRSGRVDAASIACTFADGRVAYLHVSWVDPRKRRIVRVVCRSCVLEFDDMNLQEPVRVVRARLAEEPSITTFGEFQLMPRTGDITIPAVALGEPLKAECQAFLDAVAAGHRPLADVLDGVRVCALLDAAERSVAAGGAGVALEGAPREATAAAS